MSELILASSSKYRNQLLQRLQIPFNSQSPAIDETPLLGESPQDLVMRLSVEKAQAVAAGYPEAIVIGSDQVAVLGHHILGKPLTVAKAREQLQSFSDKRVEFFTGLCVLVPNGPVLSHVDQTVVRFRSLQPEEIQRYVDMEQPLDCAGGFKVESLGLSLFKAVESKDPSALMGLPLIALSGFLRQAGLKVP